MKIQALMAVLASLSLLTFFQNCSQDNFSSVPTASTQSTNPIPTGSNGPTGPTGSTAQPTVTVTATNCSSQNPTCEVTLALSKWTGPAVTLTFLTACLNNNGDVTQCPTTGTGGLPYGTAGTDFTPNYTDASPYSVTLSSTQPTVKISIQDVAPNESASYEFLIPLGVQDCNSSSNTGCDIVFN